LKKICHNKQEKGNNALDAILLEYNISAISKTILMKQLLELILSFVFPISNEEQKLLAELYMLTPEILLTEAVCILPLPQENMLSVLSYKHPQVKALIWRLKYKNQKRFAKLLAECLYQTLLEELSDKKIFNNFSKPLLIPIPLSKKRMRERGFNQSALIAYEMSLMDEGRNFTLDAAVLYRIKDNEHQAQLKDKRARFQNSKETFAVLNKEKVSKRNILLLDDVITSGATILSAKKELRRAGARNVFMISVAH
jgi:ComF family protein